MSSDLLEEYGFAKSPDEKEIPDFTDFLYHVDQIDNRPGEEAPEEPATSGEEAEEEKTPDPEELPFIPYRPKP